MVSSIKENENDPFTALPSPVDPEAWSANTCDEVVSYLKQTLLLDQQHGDVHGSARGRKDRNCGAFTKKQEYCRICGTIGTALRLGQLDRGGGSGDGGSGLRGGSVAGGAEGRYENGEEASALSGARHPYADFTSGEYRLIRKLLIRCFLPDALDMRDDRVSNVRLTLMGALRCQPPEVRDDPKLRGMLTTLEEEVHTWEGGWDNDYGWGDQDTAAGGGVIGGGASTGAPGTAVARPAQTGTGVNPLVADAPSSSGTSSVNTAFSRNVIKTAPGNDQDGDGGSVRSASSSYSGTRNIRSASSSGGHRAPRRTVSGGGEAERVDTSVAVPSFLRLSQHTEPQRPAAAQDQPTSPAGSVDGASSLASI